MNPTSPWRVAPDSDHWRIETLDGTLIATVYSRDIADQIVARNRLFASAELAEAALEDLENFVEAREDDEDGYAHRAVDVLDRFLGELTGE